MGTGTLVHSLGSMNLSPMIPYLIFNKDSIFKRNSSVRLKKGKTSSSDHSKQSYLMAYLNSFSFNKFM